MCEYRGVKPRCAMKVTIGCRKVAQSTDHLATASRFEWEHLCRDPKDGELCLNRAKPGETRVEARSDSDVQIDRQIWV